VFGNSDKANDLRGRYVVTALAVLTIMAFVGSTSAVAQVGQAEEDTIQPTEADAQQEDATVPIEVITEPIEVTPNEPIKAAAAPVEKADEPDDVMRPTEHGFRLSPRLAEMGARMWVRQEAGKWVDLTERQEEELARRVGRRVMAIAHEHSEQGREFIEFMVETQLATGGRMANMSLDKKQEFGEQMSQWLPVLRNLLKDMARDTRPLLSREQWQEAKKGLSSGFKELNRLEDKMRRWAEGGAREDEDIDDFEGQALGERKPGSKTGKGDDGKSMSTSVALRRARRRARAELDRLQRGEWKVFLDNASEYFNFKDGQREDGWTLAKHFRKLASDIMTPEWRHRLMENRIKYHLRWDLGESNQANTPWIYHLERQYNKEVAKLEKLKAKYKRVIITLATDEQRKAAATGLLQRAKKHGMELDDNDIKIIELAND